MRQVCWLCISLSTLIAASGANAQSAPFLVVGLPGVYNGESVESFLARILEEMNHCSCWQFSCRICRARFERATIDDTIAVEECLNRWRENWYKGDYEQACFYASKSILVDPKNKETQRIHTLTNKVLDKLNCLNVHGPEVEQELKVILVYSHSWKCCWDEFQPWTNPLDNFKLISFAILPYSEPEFSDPFVGPPEDIFRFWIGGTFR